MPYVLAQAFWFIVPAMWANMAPIWAKKIPALDALDIPIDKGRTLNGKPLFGRNKTVRGYVSGIIAGIGIALLQFFLSELIPVFNNLEFFNMGFVDYVSLGLVTGFGALLGDSLESLVKRQLNKQPGKAWFPFDQLDYVVAAIIISLPFVTLTISQYAAIVFVGFFFHPLATVIGYKMGLKDAPI